MMNGYIKLFRQMTEWEWYTDADTMRVFIHLLLKANHKDKKWQGIEVKRGQCITGRKELAAELNISEQRVRTALNHLKSTNELTIKSTKKYSLVTIANWALYQLDDGGATNKSTNRATNNQPTTNQQLTTNKNDKNEKNDKNIIQRENREKVEKSLGMKYKQVDRETLRFTNGETVEVIRGVTQLTEEESTEMLKHSHEQFAPIKARIAAEAAQRIKEREVQ